MVKLHPIANWRQGWKWASVHFTVTSVAINTYGAIALKGAAAAASVLGLFPMRVALLIGAAVSLSALVARFFTTKAPQPK